MATATLLGAKDCFVLRNDKFRGVGMRACLPNGPSQTRLPRATIAFVIDEELTSPEAFSLAVRARASYFARHVIDYEAGMLRPYAQLTLLLGVELEPALNALTSRGLRGAYRWAMDGAAPVT